MTRTECVLVVAIAALVILAGVDWCGSMPRAGLATQASVMSVAAVGAAAPDSIDAAARATAAADPFRLERRPALVAYRPDLEGMAPPTKPAKPQLVLEGLVGSTALIDGAPGHLGTSLVHAGDTLGGLRIRRIGRDTVVVMGADTTWRLTLSQAWQ